MCGRFTLTITVDAVAERFAAVSEVPVTYPEARYNIAPGQESLVVTAAAQRQVHTMRWGLRPEWARDRLKGQYLINLRAESLRDKPTFRRLLTAQRCLVPADSFYEWAHEASGRGTPYRFVLTQREPFALAGLWEWETTPEGVSVPSFTIVTTAANATVAAVHDRMPVILPRAAEAVWLGGRDVPTAELIQVLQPYPGGELTRYAVSSAVSSIRNDGPECIRPVATQPGLWGLAEPR